MRNFLAGLMVSVVVILSVLGGMFVEKKMATSKVVNQKVVLNEENVVIGVAEKVSQSVVTVAINKDLGTGFIVSSDGLIVTNKHVVSDLSASYKVITKDNVEYQVKNIYRDPVNDLAILKIEPADKKLVAAEMGDSGSLKVGQFVIAIGTALGEFRHTVTTGVVSGLGRGIVAGDGFSVSEQLDGVIQTDAAINLGNSGGPLLNSLGQVIGVNVAVAGGAQNIGFALPINVVRDSLSYFKDTGQFDRPQFGVRYRMLDQQAALLNDLPEGAYVVEVLAGSSADKAGVRKADVIVSINGIKIKDIKGGLATLIGQKKIGDKIEVELFRGGKTQKISVVLEEAKD